MAAAIYYFGAIFFVIFGDGEVQEWAEFYEDDTMTPAEEAEMGVGFGLHEITEKVVEEDEDEEDKPTEKMLESNGDTAKDVKV